MRGNLIEVEEAIASKADLNAFVVVDEENEYTLLHMAVLNDHLDAGGCGDEPEPVRAAPQGQRTRPEADSINRLAQEMRCSICFELYDNPHSLPCQHSFCYECVMGCFRATRKMECPLCKAPVWKRQLTTNHTLAGIVKAFVSLQEQSGNHI